MQFEPVAVVAAECRLPGAADLREFFRNNQEGVCSIGRAQDAFWDGCEVYDKHDAGHLNTSYTDLGGFLDPWELDRAAFRIAPRVIERMDPVHALGLEMAHRVLDQAERGGPLPHDETAVIVANVAGGSTSRINANMKVQSARWAAALRRREPALAEVLEEHQRNETARHPDKREDLALNGESGTIGGRIANYFGLRGVHYGIDAACGSSLAALHSACMGLHQGEFDAALVVAVGILTPDIFVVNSAARTLSKDGSFPFGALANGLVPGEGGVGVLLMRLSDARRQGRPVLGVVRAIGYSANGRTTSTWGPSADAEEQAIRRAFDGVPFGMAEVDYVEAHGTSTRAGDGAEFEAMLRTYGAAARRRPLPFGSAKSLIGHTVESAGLVGLLRGLFLFGTGTLPPTVNIDNLRPEVAAAADRLRLQRTTEDLAPPSSRPRRVGVSAFGYGGINYHLLLEQPESESASAAPRPARSRPARDTTPVAITAVEAVQPDAADAAAFWQNLREGLASSQDLRVRVPSLDQDLDDAGLGRQADYFQRAAFTQVRRTVDSARFRILPKQVPGLTDEFLVLLSCAANLADAVNRATAAVDPSRAGCIIGQLPDSDLEFELMQSLRLQPWLRRLRRLARSRGVEAPWTVLRDELWNDADLELHSVDQDTAVAGFGSTLSSTLASAFDLRGKSYAVRAACATGLAALSLGVQELRQQTLDFVLCGAVGMGVGLVNHTALAAIRALSANGCGRPYDEKGDGFIMGGGAGLLCLKRLPDAERDGDPILAVVREVRGGSDGKGRSLLAPNPEGRRFTMERTYRGVDLDRSSIGYVEGHGAATALGDQSEVEALSAVLGNGETVFLGSVKGNVGHQKGASGMTSLIKTVLCLNHGELVPTPGFRTPHPALDLDSRNFQVVTETRPWPAPSGGRPRAAAVNAFGLGGINYHAVLEEYRPATAGQPAVSRSQEAEQPQAIAVWTAPDRLALEQSLAAFAERGEAPPPLDPGHAHRVAIDGGSGPDAAGVLRERARRYLAVGPDKLSPAQWDALGVHTGRTDLPHGGVCRLYPGQGSQYPGMLREAADAIDGIRERVGAAAEVLAAQAPDLMAHFWRGEEAVARHWLSRTENCQVATLLAGAALGGWLDGLGVAADFHLGHSFGEVSALAAADALSFDDALLTAHRRGVIAAGSRGGARQGMAVLFTSPTQAEHLIGEDGEGGDVVVANRNSRRQVVLAGRAEAVSRVVERAAADGVEARTLPIERAFHSPLLRDAVPAYREFLGSMAFSTPSAPVYETLTSRPYPRDAPPDRIRQSLADQFVLPVYFETMVQDVYDRGARIFVEVGPKRALSSLVGECLGAKPDVRTVTLLHPKGGELAQVRRAAAQMWAIGLTNVSPVLDATARKAATCSE